MIYTHALTPVTEITKSGLYFFPPEECENWLEMVQVRDPGHPLYLNADKKLSVKECGKPYARYVQISHDRNGSMDVRFMVIAYVNLYE